MLLKFSWVIKIILGNGYQFFAGLLSRLHFQPDGIAGIFYFKLLDGEAGFATCLTLQVLPDVEPG